ncbi:MAG: hypothetical protein L3J05_00915, partial [Robiginitomaculum sp.]|nr:hypothetical protein [Robiginitomaculum sp.]
LSWGFDFKSKFSAKKVQPGAILTVELHFDLKEGNGPYYVYAPGTPFGTPLEITIKGSENVKQDGEWQYPAHKVVDDPDVGQMYKLLGKVVIVHKVKVPADAKVGDKIKIWGYVTGQYCDETGCIDFSSLDPTSPNRAFGWVATAVIADDGVANAVTKPKGDADEGSDSFSWFLLVAFLAGMVTLLTPCVLPVLPLTVGFFVSQAEKGKSPFLTALIYCLCIIGSFTFFGLITSIALGATGAQSISTNGYVNVALGVLFMVFALSFLGMFELRMPMFLSSWLNKKQMGAQKEGKGYAKAFFSGTAFAVISFSCTGPIAGGFLAAAAGGDFLTPTFAMLAFSSGLALPIFLLGQFPSLMKKMPKSGGWMNALKVVFGFIELGLAIMYLSAAEQAFMGVQAAEWINRFVVIAVWGASSFAIAMYLFGLFRMPHDHEDTKQIGVIRAIFAVGFLSFALFMLPGMFGAKYGYLEGILPLPPKNGGITLPMGGGHENDPHSLPWNRVLEDGLLEAKEKNMPVFVDFTGFN